MRKLLLLLGILFPLLAQAETLPELQQTIHAAQPYGSTPVKWMLWDIYDMQLWTDSPVFNFQFPFALSLRYKLNFSTDELVNTSIDEMRRIDQISDSQSKIDRNKLATVFPNVHPGDTITALAMSPSTTLFFYNHKPTGRIEADSFTKAFFDIWLSEKTKIPAARLAILGHHE